MRRGGLRVDDAIRALQGLLLSGFLLVRMTYTNQRLGAQRLREPACVEERLGCCCVCLQDKPHGGERLYSQRRCL